MRLVPRAIEPLVRQRLETQPAVVRGRKRFSLGGGVTATPLA